MTLVELQMDDGLQGDFTTIFSTVDRDYLIVASNITRGHNYRFRYRSKNVNGYSEYSDTAYIYAFSTPGAPPAPTFTSATDTTVTLGLTQSSTDNGIAIAGYELWIDAGNDLTSQFT